MADLREWRPRPYAVVATVRAHGFIVQVRRGEGPHLVLEAAMTGRKRGAKLTADSGTADVSLGKARARAFAAGLAEETNGKGKLPLHVPTYDELRAEISRREVDTANLRTVLNRWLEVFALDASELVGPEMAEELEERLADFREALFSRGMKRKPVNSYLTRARKLASIAGSMMRVEADGLTFGDALRQALDTRGITAATLGTAVAISADLIRHWWAGTNIPGRRNRAVIPMMERVLEVPDGWLVSHLPPLAPTRAPSQSQFGALLEEYARAKGYSCASLAVATGIDVRVVRRLMYNGTSPSLSRREDEIPRLELALGLEEGRLSSALPPLIPKQVPYALKLNAAQEREWNGLFVHKTDLNQRDPSQRPREFWKVFKGRCPTAKGYRSTLERFKGYLALPSDAADPRMRGLGLDPEEWGLSNLANETHVTGFLDFLATRNGYNGGTVVFIAFVRSLLRPKTGYFWQGNRFDWGSFRTAWLDDSCPPEPFTLDTWRSHCELVHENLGTWLRHLFDTEQIEPTRDYQHISPILDMAQPMDALCVLQERLLEYLCGRRGRVSDLDFAIDFRDTLLVLMMMRNPLRAHHWEIMTYNPSGLGHLRKTEHGYELHYSKKEFKALAGVRQKEYRARVAPDLTEMLDEYFSRWRPILGGSRFTDRVFVSSVHNPAAAGRCFLINEVMMRVTAAHLSEFVHRGFGPHAFRHIIATHFVKNYYEDGIMRAADALHNTPEMIKKHYGHLRAEDVTHRSHELINRELSAGFDRIKKS